MIPSQPGKPTARRRRRCFSAAGLTEKSRAAGETYHHSVTTLAIDLTKRFELDVSFVRDHTQNPEQESNGTIPQQNDVRLIVSLGIRF